MEIVWKIADKKNFHGGGAELAWTIGFVSNGLHSFLRMDFLTNYKWYNMQIFDKSFILIKASIVKIVFSKLGQVQKY